MDFTNVPIINFIQSLIPFKITSKGLSYADLEKNKAIEAFLEYEKRLCTKSFKNDILFSQLTDLVGKYIGPNSAQYAELKKRSYLENFYKYNKKQNEEVFYTFEPDKVSAMVGNFVHYIKLNGVYKEYKGNFLSRMGDEAAVALVFGIIGIVGAGGYFCGNFFAANKFDYEKIELKHDVDSLRRLLAIPLPPTAKLDTGQSNKIRVGQKPDKENKK